MKVAGEEAAAYNLVSSVDSYSVAASLQTHATINLIRNCLEKVLDELLVARSTSAWTEWEQIN